MALNSIRTRAEPDAVFDVLDDACAYPRWVVGARRVRAVDPSWPAVGSRFHHALGTSVGELHDSSLVLEHDRPRRLVLEVRFRPVGVARVSLEIARRPRFHREMAELPDTVTAHVLPTGGGSTKDDRLLAYRDFAAVRRRIDAAYAASRDYLAEHL